MTEAANANETRTTICVDYARTQAGFTEPGWAPGSFRHTSGLAELQVIDPECALRLALFRRQAKFYTDEGFTYIETGSISLSNLKPDMFATVIDAVTATF